MITPGPTKNMAGRVAWVLLCVVVILVPAALLARLDACFGYDWENHQWFVGYFGEYWRQHHRMPEVMNSASVVGMPQPVFYGYALYPMLGLLSSWTGAAIALRIGVVAAFTFQFVAVFGAVRRATSHRITAFVAAVAMTWAVYPLTNLYNRSALTEFFAVAFLTTGVAFAASLLLEKGRCAWAFAWFSGAFFVAAAGAHPPTALLGGGFMLALLLAGTGAIASGHRLRRSTVVSIAIVSILGLMVLLPWLWANLSFHGELNILTKYRRFSFFMDRSDAWWMRFFPLPYDGLSGARPDQVSTPYAESQVSIALLVIGLWQAGLLARHALQSGASLWKQHRCAVLYVAIGIVWFGLVAAVSVSFRMADWFSWLAPYVQFPSRLVSHVNLALLVVIVASSVALGGHAYLGGRGQRWRIGVCLLALAVSAIGLVIKLDHAAYARKFAPDARYGWHGDRSGLITAGRVDAANDYASVQTLPQLLPKVVRKAARADFPVGTAGTGFGKVETVAVTLGQPGWVVTNAVAFRWASIELDGGARRTERYAANDHRLALWLPEGTHQLRWIWHPNVGWLLARKVAVGCAVILVMGCLMGAFVVGRESVTEPLTR